MSPKTIIAMLILTSTSYGGAVFARSSSKDVTQDVIVVTANKMEESLYDIPESITVLDDIILEERRIDTVKKVLDQIPNMYSVEGVANLEANVRGLNLSMHSLTNPIVIYLDGIPITNRYGSDIPLVDIERIEVLRGPQGTLYGKDAIGGVINIISKQPEEEWQSAISAEYGNFNTRRANFNASGAIADDWLFARVWGETYDDDGWIDNHHGDTEIDANDEKQRRLGLSLLVRPSERFSAHLKLIHSQQNQGFANGGMVADAEAFNHAKREDFEKANYDVESFEDTRTNAQGLTLKYQTEKDTFESVTSHHKAYVNGQWDADYGYVDALLSPPAAMFNGMAYIDDSTHSTLSQEFRWSRRLSSGTRWVTGLYYEKQDIDYHNFALQMFGQEFSYVSDNESETRAIFAHYTQPLLDKLELTLGGRYQRVEKSIDQDYRISSTAISGLDSRNDWSAFLPKLVINYKSNDKFTTYLSVAKGYIPGGFNYWASSNSIDDHSYDPQETWSYEWGTKSRFMGQKLLLSSALFYMDISDIHVDKIKNNFSITTNAAKAKSYGLELEADYFVNQQWQLNAALGLIRAEYDDFIDKDGNVNNGNKIERTPEYSLNIGLQYNSPSNWFARFDVINYGNVYFDSANTIEQKPYTVLNLKAGYTADNWDVYAYVNNATDTDYKVFGRTGAPAGVLVEFGEPLQFGIGAKYRFASTL